VSVIYISPTESLSDQAGWSRRGSAKNLFQSPTAFLQDPVGSVRKLLGHGNRAQDARKMWCALWESDFVQLVTRKKKDIEEIYHEGDDERCYDRNIIHGHGIPRLDSDAVQKLARYLRQHGRSCGCIDGAVAKEFHEFIHIVA
jgi:hypothetical protein